MLETKVRIALNRLFERDSSPLSQTGNYSHQASRSRGFFRRPRYMFESACNLHTDVFCNFGGGSPAIKGKLHATACLLSPSHVITAAHNIEEMTTRYSWPVVSKFDGLFKCEVLALDDTVDIAILRTTDCLETVNRKVPIRYPTLATKRLAMGMTVGYMTWLHKTSPSGRSMFRYFSTAHVSYLGECEFGHPRWILSGGFVEPGFSGSPVFLPDGSLIGIIVGASTMTQDMGIEGLSPIIHSLPQVSSIPSLASALAEEIRQAAAL